MAVPVRHLDMVRFKIVLRVHQQNCEVPTLTMVADSCASLNPKTNCLSTENNMHDSLYNLMSNKASLVCNENDTKLGITKRCNS